MKVMAHTEVVNDVTITVTEASSEVIAETPERVSFSSRKVHYLRIEGQVTLHSKEARELAAAILRGAEELDKINSSLQ
jgi:hypothetical protein